MKFLFNVLLFSAKLMSLKCQMSAVSNYISTKQDMVYVGGNRLGEIQDADDMFCALSCSRTDGCHGVNFEIKPRVCHLMAFGSPKFKEASGFVFMEMLKRENISKKVSKNCAELYKAGDVISGVYKVDPDGLGVFDVYCDQTTEGGGWTVFQKRLDGSVNFFRGWREYKEGFGNLRGEFWLGLDRLNRLTRQNNSRLRVELEDFQQNTSYAEYDLFSVSNKTDKYRLHFGNYSGTAGDSLRAHIGIKFSTKDQDNDRNSTINCAQKCKGAWWYRNCMQTNLNGQYHPAGYHQTPEEGINWRRWKGLNYSAKRAEMKIRPVGFLTS